jgi:hypothetical protein
MKSQPFDGVRLPLRPLPLAGTGGTKPFPLAAAILAWKGGLFCAVQEREKCQKQKMARNSCRGGKRLQTGVQYHAY